MTGRGRSRGGENFFTAAVWKCWRSLEERDQKDEDSATGTVVANEPCKGEGRGRILLRDKQRERGMEKRRAAEWNKSWRIKENKV